MIQCSNLKFSYDAEFVIHDLSFTIKDGEFVGVIGPNGSGKSTLLKLIDRILTPCSGKIMINQKNQWLYSQKELARIIGYVQQDFTTVYNFSVQDMVLMGRFPHQKLLGFDSAEDIRIAMEAMDATDCLYLKDRDFLTLSGGERQRVILASALAQEPLILLLDEPTSALDLKHQLHFYEILRKLQKEKNITILTVTHDVNLAAQFSDRIMVIKHGRIVADGTVSAVLNEEILQRVYEVPLQIFPHPALRVPVIFPQQLPAK